MLGGGHVGVEVASNIASKHRDINVIFAVGNSGLLPNHPPGQIQYAQNFFDGLPNIELKAERCSEMEIEGGGDGAGREFKFSKSGTVVRVSEVIKCTGFGKANTGFLDSCAIKLSEEKRIVVSPDTLAVEVRMCEGYEERSYENRSPLCRPFLTPSIIIS